MPTIEDALELALQAHRGQTDKNGQPYILHPIRVMTNVTGDTAKMVALLHDVVEDSPVTLDDLRALGFDETIVAAVDSVTQRDGEDYFKYVRRAGANPLGRQVKLADLQDNMDIRRLSEIGEKDVARLQKYLRAWALLTGQASDT